MFNRLRLHFLLKRATQLSHVIDRGGFVDQQEIYRLQNKIKRLQEPIMHLAPFNAALKEYFPLIHMEGVSKRVVRRKFTAGEEFRQILDQVNKLK